MNKAPYKVIHIPDYKNKMMNRNKVDFGFVCSKPIEATDFVEEFNEPSSPNRERAKSSILNYGKHDKTHDLLRAPVTR